MSNKATELIKKLRNVIMASDGDMKPPVDKPVDEPVVAAPQAPAPQVVDAKDLEKYALKEELNKVIAQFTAMIESLKGLTDKSADVPAMLSAMLSSQEPVTPVEPVAETPVTETPVTEPVVVAPVEPVAVTPSGNAGLDVLKQVAQAPVAQAPVAPVAVEPVVQAPVVAAPVTPSPVDEPEVVHSPTATVEKKLTNLLPNRPKSRMDAVMKNLWG